MPKIGSHKLTAFSKLTAHTKSGKILFMDIQVTTCYYFRGYHAFNKKHCYYMVQMWLVTMCSRLSYMLLLLKVTMYSYYKSYAKNGSHILTASFLSMLHILGQVKYLWWRARLLQASADRCYHALKKKSFYYTVQFKVVTMYSSLFLHATTVKGDHVFLLHVICQKRKPQIDGLLTAHTRSGKF